MKSASSLRNIVGVLLFAACSYFLGCEPNELIQSLPNGGVDPTSQLDAGNPSANSAVNGGNPNVSNANVPNEGGGQFVSNRIPNSNFQGLPTRDGSTILIASFNIQVFGKSKMSKANIPHMIAEVVHQFDVVAIQEIRDASQQTIPQLMQYINVNGYQYDYLISQPLGRTSSKEQYCYIYNTKTVVGSPDATYIIDDQRDLLHREPYVARFVTRLPVGYQPFTFTLVNIHTDPDEVAQEIPVMHTVLRSIRNFEYVHAREDDVILLGDLNVDPRKFGELGRLPGIYWTVDTGYTNTRKDKILDNILFDRVLTNEYTNRSGVLELESMFGISRDQALEISDHLPIWAEFTIFEQPSGPQQQFASGNNVTTSR